MKIYENKKVIFFIASSTFVVFGMLTLFTYISDENFLFILKTETL